MTGAYNVGDMVYVIPFDDIPDFKYKHAKDCFGVTKEYIDVASIYGPYMITKVIGDGYAYRLRNLSFSWEEHMLSRDRLAKYIDEFDEDTSGITEVLI